MRDALTNSPVLFSVMDGQSTFPIRFTGDAIKYLSSANTSINLKDWRWHEEEINGQRHCVITDRLSVTDN